MSQKHFFTLAAARAENQQVFDDVIRNALVLASLEVGKETVIRALSPKIEVFEMKKAA